MSIFLPRWRSDLAISYSSSSFPLHCRIHTAYVPMFSERHLFSFYSKLYSFIPFFLFSFLPMPTYKILRDIVRRFSSILGVGEGYSIKKRDEKMPCSLLFFIICVSFSTDPSFAFYFISSFASLNLPCIIISTWRYANSSVDKNRPTHIHTHKNYSLCKEIVGKQWK